MEKKLIYLDYQAAKPVDERVLQMMLPYFTTYYGNPSSLHENGDIVTEILQKSRERVARLINATHDEIIFTGGATEANNLALIGFAQRNRTKGNHLIISEVEHISLFNISKFLEKQGFVVSRVPVDQFGQINLTKLEKRITDKTILISIQYANNEIGTIQPIEQIAEIASKHQIAFHTDAVAAESEIPIDVKKVPIDMLTLSSNDIYGPKGVGALFLKKGARIVPQVLGGGQEFGFRSGSENIPGIVGMAVAAELMQSEMSSEVARLRQYQQKLIHDIAETIPKAYLNGHPEQRLANNVHFRFDAIEGESILLSLKAKGIAVATGSACSSKTLEPSHTLIATGLLHEEAHGSLELTTGRFTTIHDIDELLAVLPGIVANLRKLSPLYRKTGKPTPFSAQGSCT